MAERKHKKTAPESEWKDNPPLPPRGADPTGEADALRDVADADDATVFEANEETVKRKIDRKKKPDATVSEPGDTADDGKKSRTER